MTRQELLNLLGDAQAMCPFPSASRTKLQEIIKEIQTDGVLDVQCPEDIAISMDLPRPKEFLSKSVSEF